jgi:cytochrome c peroxidase
MGKFKTPSLRNVAVTAPYMHDGSLKTLDAVLDHYAAGGNATRRGRRSPLTSPLIAGFTISPAEKQDLIAFLNALTDKQFLHDPRFGTPFR